ncbi:MAG: undecaprenyldiphospho-muramoylpentapeptide beta-N-acetylglucosaminyltransferase [Spiribacter sp.]|nr:undecaprenyldiphospho-muramoylpentapeptide beta-N-acetylglucosaminyltransferase [Spiribacter sp.]
MSVTPVMIVAGGTGGHVFPALAVARELERRGTPVIWLGTPGGLEARVVPEAGIAMETTTVRGLRGNGLRGWLMAPWMILLAVLQCRAVIRRHQPRSMLGMGGYVTGPAGLAARWLGCPLVIHEQNAIAGLTNRLLARLASRVLTGLEAEFSHHVAAEFTGNPVREAIAALPAPTTRYAERQGPMRLLVMGGSLGALTLNRIVPAALARLPGDQRPEVRHQAGPRTLETARQAYADARVEATVSAFIDDMAEAYGWCDLVICRAGALTVSELATAGVPAILVPYPHAVDDHQSANARRLVEAGGAELIADDQLEADRLAVRLERLLSDRRVLAHMGEAAGAFGRPDAATRVADVCLEVAA